MAWKTLFAGAPANRFPFLFSGGYGQGLKRKAFVFQFPPERSGSLLLRVRLVFLGLAFLGKDCSRDLTEELGEYLAGTNFLEFHFVLLPQVTDGI